MPVYKEDPFEIYQYSDEEKEAVRKHLGIKDSTIEEDVDALQEWFQKQPHLIGAGLPDRDFLERMLIFAKGSREKTKRRIDNYYRHRSYAPDLIQDRSGFLDNVNHLLNFFHLAAMPRLFDLKRITVFRFTISDPNQYNCENLFKTAILLGDLRTKYDYMTGDIWILDLQNINFGHLLRTNPVILQKATQIFQDGLGIRIACVHLLGSSSIINQVIKLFKRFTSPKIMDRLVLHESVSDLYKDIPQKYLPEDYGGEQPSLAQFKEKYIKILRCEKTREFLESCSKQVSDENLRPDAVIHEEFISGSFKKLDID